MTFVTPVFRAAYYGWKNRDTFEDGDIDRVIEGTRYTVVYPGESYEGNENWSPYPVLVPGTSSREEEIYNAWVVYNGVTNEVELLDDDDFQSRYRVVS